MRSVQAEQGINASIAICVEPRFCRDVGHSAGLLSPFAELSPAVPLLRGSVFELLPLLAGVHYVFLNGFHRRITWTVWACGCPDSCRGPWPRAQVRPGLSSNGCGHADSAVVAQHSRRPRTDFGSKTHRCPTARLGIARRNRSRNSWRRLGRS